MVYMTFTPEQGMTETVAAFMNNIKKGQSLTNATWDDASENVKSLCRGREGIYQKMQWNRFSLLTLPHEREMRRYGRPSIGSGLIFPINEEDLMIDPSRNRGSLAQNCGHRLWLGSPYGCGMVCNRQ